MSSQAGTATIEIVTVADRSLAQGTRLSEAGRLRTMVIVNLNGLAQRGSCYVEAGLMSGGVGDAYKSAILAAGYCAVGAPTRWNGDIPISPGDVFYLEARSAVANVIRLNFLVEREV